MAARRLITGLLGVGCIGAAGVSGYLAVRSSQTVESRTGVEAAALAAPEKAGPVSRTASGQAAGPSALAPLARVDTGTPAMVRAGEGRGKRTAASVDPVPEMAAGLTPSLVKPGQAGPDRNGRSSVDIPVADRVAVSQTEATAPAPAPTPVVADPVLPPPVPVDPPPAPAAAQTPRFEELTVKANSVVGIRLDSTVSSDTAQVEDRVVARVSRDVEVDGRTVISEGARLEGTVTLVDKGGRFRERARLEVRFHTLVLNNTTRIPIETDRIFRDGEAPGGEATSKIGASAVVGSILGAVIGGKKGAAIGGGVGAAGGTAAVMAGGTNAALMAAGSPYTVRLTAPVAVLVGRDQDPR